MAFLTFDLLHSKFNRYVGKISEQQAYHNFGRKMLAWERDSHYMWLKILLLQTKYTAQKWLLSITARRPDCDYETLLLVAVDAVFTEELLFPCMVNYRRPISLCSIKGHPACSTRTS